jgi:tetratricopeptide (TPR) repeat protein
MHIPAGELEQALAASEEHDRLGHDAGLETAPARTAFLLARLGRIAEAVAVVEDALTRLPRLHPFGRPHYDLARALLELGRHAEAVTHARQAYRRAWAEGSPNYHYWDLQDARELLNEMGEPVPDLPVVDPASVTIPFEDKITAFIAILEAEWRASGETNV